jgi:hypothetical protein
VTRGLKLAIAGALLVLTALGARPDSASAQVVPATPTTSTDVTLTPNPVRALGAVTIDATGFQPGSLVAIDVAGLVRLDRISADDSGAIHATVTLPAAVVVGDHQLLISGFDPAGAPRSLTAALQVESGFGNTGAPPLVWTTVALGAIAVGQLLLRMEHQLRATRRPALALRSSASDGAAPHRIRLRTHRARAPHAPIKLRPRSR